MMRPYTIDETAGFPQLRADGDIMDQNFHDRPSGGGLPPGGGRIPPQALEAETCVLGAMLLEKEAIGKAVEILEPGCFYRDAHRRVFEATMNRDEMVRFFEMAKEAGGSGGPDGEDWDPNGPADDGNPFGTPESELTHVVDVSAFVDVKRSSIRCHKSQITDAGFFSTMPDEQFAFAFGHEWFIEAGSSAPLRDGWLFE
jgi:hypothetical protein